MKKHEVSVEALQAWKDETKVLFASSSRENKKLYATLDGGFEIHHNGEKVYGCIQPFAAVEAYNKIN